VAVIAASASAITKANLMSLYTAILRFSR